MSAGEDNSRVVLDECPVCLEPLEGTIVQLGCCHNKVHIQCYLPKCPLCRSVLPLPKNTETNHIIVPVPVTPVQPTRIQKAAMIVPALGGILGIGIFILLMNAPYR